MRTPRRDFAVEYKSTRRQTKPQPKSIWGNVDLRAVARQVDADDALSMPEPTQSEPVETQRAEPSSPSNAATHLAANFPDNVDGRQPLADAEPETVDAVQPPDPEVSINEPHLAGNAATSSPRTRDRKSPGRKSSAQTTRFSHSVDAPNASLPPVALGDDILALDAENRRLKRLLADKLRNENEQLRSILGRFSNGPVV